MQRYILSEIFKEKGLFILEGIDEEEQLELTVDDFENDKDLCYGNIFRRGKDKIFYLEK